MGSGTHGEGAVERRQLAQLDALVLHLLLVLRPQQHLDHRAGLVHLHHAQLRAQGLGFQGSRFLGHCSCSLVWASVRFGLGLHSARQGAPLGAQD